MVSLPTRGTSLRLTASSATRRTVQRARPSGGTTAYHGNQTLFLAIVEHFRCSGSLFLIQRPIQTALLITAADVADGLWRQRNYAGDAGRGDTLGQLQKSQGTQNNTDLLDSAAHQRSKFFLILGGDLNTQGWTSHALSMRQNISDWNCFMAKSSSGQRPSTTVL